jgi:hypothetical protein
MNFSSCAIIISSCDGYSDAWGPFFDLFFKYWPDCPYRVYLIANNLKYPDDRVITLNINPDGNWAANMVEALAQIEEKYLIYLQEDYFIKSRVDNNYLSSLLNIVSQEAAACLRIFPCPGPDRDYKDYANIGEIDRFAPYRVSLQAAIWDKGQLLQLINSGESAWDMEIKGSERSRNVVGQFLSIKRGQSLPLDYLCTAIVKGRWTKDAVKLLHENHIEVDFKKRKIESKFSLAFGLAKHWLVKFRNLLFKK